MFGYRLVVAVGEVGGGICYINNNDNHYGNDDNPLDIRTIYWTSNGSDARPVYKFVSEQTENCHRQNEWPFIMDISRCVNRSYFAHEQLFYSEIYVNKYVCFTKGFHLWV